MSVEVFLKIDAVHGGNSAAGRNEVEVLSWSWSAERVVCAALGKSSGAGEVSTHDFGLTIYTGREVPELTLGGAEGRRLAASKLMIRKAAGTQFDYLKIKFEESPLPDGSGAAAAGSAPGSS